MKDNNNSFFKRLKLITDKGNIIEYSELWYKIKYALIYKENALSRSNITEIALTTTDYNNFMQNIRLTYPYIDTLMLLGAKQTDYIRLRDGIAKKVWNDLTVPKMNICSSSYK